MKTLLILVSVLIFTLNSFAVESEVEPSEGEEVVEAVVTEGNWFYEDQTEQCVAWTVTAKRSGKKLLEAVELKAVIPKDSEKMPYFTIRFGRSAFQEDIAEKFFQDPSVVEINEGWFFNKKLVVLNSQEEEVEVLEFASGLMHLEETASLLNLDDFFAVKMSAPGSKNIFFTISLKGSTNSLDESVSGCAQRDLWNSRVLTHENQQFIDNIRFIFGSDVSDKWKEWTVGPLEKIEEYFTLKKEREALGKELSELRRGEESRVLKRERSDKDFELRRLNSKLERSGRTLEGYKSKEASLKLDIPKFEAEIPVLTEKLPGLKKSYDAAEVIHQKASEAVKPYKEPKEREGSKLSSLKGELRDLESEQGDKESELDTVEDNISSYTKNLEKSLEELESVDEKRKEARTKLEELRKNKDQIRENIESSNRNTFDQIDDDIIKKEEEVTETEETRDSLSQLLGLAEISEQRIERLSKAHDEVENIINYPEGHTNQELKRKRQVRRENLKAYKRR